MQLRVYHTPREYLQDTEQYLYQDELKHNLILGIFQSFSTLDQSHPNHTYISVFENNNCIATSIKTWVKAIISCNQTNKEAISLIASHYLNQNISIQGVFGDNESVESFMQHYPVSIKEKTSMLVHSIQKINDIPSPPGVLKKLDMSYLDLVTTYTIEFEMDANLSIKNTPEVLRESSKLRLQNGVVYGWFENEKLVSIAAIVRKTKHYGIIALVYTPKELRGRGFATAAVKSLTQEIFNLGFLYGALYTDMANPTSNHIYRKIGYVPSLSFMDISFDLNKSI